MEILELAEGFETLEGISLDILNDNLLVLIEWTQKIHDIGFHILVLGLVIVILAVIYSIITKFI